MGFCFLNFSSSSFSKITVLHVHAVKHLKDCLVLSFSLEFWLLCTVAFGPLFLLSVAKIHLAFHSSVSSVFMPNTRGYNPLASPLCFFTNELPLPLNWFIWFVLFCGFGLRQASLLECKWVKHLRFLSMASQPCIDNAACMQTLIKLQLA